MRNKFNSFFAHVSLGGGCTGSALGAFQRDWGGLIVGKTEGGRRSCLDSMYCAEEGGRKRLTYICCVLYPHRQETVVILIH